MEAAGYADSSDDALSHVLHVPARLPNWHAEVVASDKYYQGCAPCGDPGLDPRAGAPARAAALSGNLSPGLWRSDRQPGAGSASNGVVACRLTALPVKGRVNQEPAGKRLRPWGTAQRRKIQRYGKG